MPVQKKNGNLLKAPYILTSSIKIIVLKRWLDETYSDPGGDCLVSLRSNGTNSTLFYG